MSLQGVSRLTHVSGATWDGAAHPGAWTTAGLAPAALGSSALLRPPDVLRSLHSYAVDVGTAGVDQALEAQQLIREAGQRLGRPRVIVARDSAEAVRLLESGGRFRTAYDFQGDPGVKFVRLDYLDARRAHELRHGTLGDGVDAERTVYGSLQLAPDLEVRGHPGMLAPRQDIALDARMPNVGAAHRFGGVAFVLSPQALLRSTFLRTDSFYTDGLAAPAESLSGVLTERLLLDVGHLTEPAGKAISRLDPVIGRSWFDRLLRQRRGAAVDEVESYLRSTSFAHNYVEAQVRSAGLDDVEGMRMYVPALLRESSVPEVRERVQVIQELARERAIPVEILE